eukprot:gene34166-42126_t
MDSLQSDPGSVSKSEIDAIILFSHRETCLQTDPDVQFLVHLSSLQGCGLSELEVLCKGLSYYNSCDGNNRSGSPVSNATATATATATMTVLDCDGEVLQEAVCIVEPEEEEEVEEAEDIMPSLSTALSTPTATSRIPVPTSKFKASLTLTSPFKVADNIAAVAPHKPDSITSTTTDTNDTVSVIAAFKTPGPVATRPSIMSGIAGSSLFNKHQQKHKPTVKFLETASGEFVYSVVTHKTPVSETVNPMPFKTTSGIPVSVVSGRKMSPALAARIASMDLSVFDKSPSARGRVSHNASTTPNNTTNGNFPATPDSSLTSVVLTRATMNINITRRKKSSAKRMSFEFTPGDEQLMAELVKTPSSVTHCAH